ncbi:zinc finger protein OZF-like [Ostrinia nubilalis]|uniref:zinc finger protein OZF-like n=1 Tax=Ostrinia nubilalis TaxID=29057 RepID=UPI0030826054
MDLKLCRLCGETVGNVNVFDTDQSGVSICSKIMHCCSKIKIENYDGLPSVICVCCEQNLATAYRFILKCEATDKTLRSQYLESKHNTVLTKIEIKSEDYEFNNSDHDLSMNYNSYDELDVPLAVVSKRIKLENTKSCKNKSKGFPKRKKKRNKQKGPENCSVCGKEFANPSTLLIHMRSHTNEKPYQCEFCDKRYKNAGSLKRHSVRNHMKIRARRFICESCGKGFYTKTDIIIHLRTHTGETPYSCSECQAVFTQLSSLIRHKKNHLGEKTEACDVCYKKFITKDSLRRHQMVHTSSKQYSCNICLGIFKYKQNLTKHYKVHSEPNSFVCNHCGRTFNSKGNLKTHMDRLHSEKSGYCNTCSKIVSNLEVHMWKHTGERPLKCELCTRSFCEVRALAHHMNFRHNKTDKFKCTVEGCLCGFPSRPMLEYHIAKVHESCFKYPCDKCSRGFYRKNDLVRHKIGTHKEKLM